MVFPPGSEMKDFLGRHYHTKGVAIAPLLSLLPVYPKPSLDILSRLQRLTTPRAERAGDTSPTEDEPALQVVLFKKFSKHLPLGLTSETLTTFFAGLFNSKSKGQYAEYKTATNELLMSGHYYIMAITAPMFVKTGDELFHYIIGAAVYLYDNKHGSYVVLLGVTDKGHPEQCTLSKQFFSDPSASGVLSPTASFRGLGLGTFILSLIQVNSFLGHKAPSIPDPSEPYRLECDERSNKCTHHLYLQARLEVGSAYVMYVQLGFSSPVVGGANNYHCRAYKDDCPVNASRKYTSNESSYHTDDDSLRLLVLKKWLHNVYPANAQLTTDSDYTKRTLWNQPGLDPNHQFLASALVPPFQTPQNTSFTNLAYINVLDCRLNLGENPLPLVRHLPSIGAAPFPIDRLVSNVTRTSGNLQMIIGSDFPPADI